MYRLSQAGVERVALNDTDIGRDPVAMAACEPGRTRRRPLLGQGQHGGNARVARHRTRLAEMLEGLDRKSVV